VYSRLVSRGAAVIVVTAAPGRDAGRRTVDGIDVVTAPALDLTRIVGAQLAVGRRLSRTARTQAETFHPQVLHANGLYFHSSVVAARLSRRTGLPLVTTVHVAGVDRLRGATGLATDAYERTVGRRILRASTRVVCVSEAVRSRALGLGVEADLLTVVPNGVDADRFTSGSRPTSPAAPVVTFVGRLIENKGPALLVEALGRLCREGLEFTGVFVGDGPLRSTLAARAADLGLGERVRFVGHVDDVAPALATTDVAVRPSYTEGMSLAVLEAMAAGCCTVVSDIPANVEVVRHGENGLTFATGDSEALAATLRTALTDPGLRERLGRAARAVAERHTWDGATTGLARALVAAVRRG
jgi:1,4-alpha-glucan branching enzyme